MALSDEQAQQLTEAVQGIRAEVALLGETVREASESFARSLAELRPPRPTTTARVSAPMREPVRSIRPRRSDDEPTPA